MIIELERYVFAFLVLNKFLINVKMFHCIVTFSILGFFVHLCGVSVGNVAYVLAIKISGKKKGARSATHHGTSRKLTEVSVADVNRN